MTYSRASLENKKMGELREIGRKFGASDTKKSELIDEILEKQPRPKGKSSIQDLLDKLEQYKGDLVRTYSLRDDIIKNLKKRGE